MSRKSLGCGGTSAFVLLCLAIRIIAKLWAFQDMGSAATATPVINPNQEWIDCQSPVFEALNPIAKVWMSLAETESWSQFCRDGAGLQAMLLDQQRLHRECGVPEHDALASIAVQFDCTFNSWLGAYANIQRYCDSEELVFLTLANAAYMEGKRCLSDTEPLFDQYLNEYLESQQ